ncbi:hypothetical protein HY406_00680 [Candidatus Giovannonibacteria bacterium]|nr:hypothetical protein [Candidatus Giovannonibacteria bacterium]
MARKKRRRRRRQVCLIGIPAMLLAFRDGIVITKRRKQWGIPVPVTIFGIGGR